MSEEDHQLLYRRIDSVCSEFDAETAVNVLVALLAKEIVHSSKPDKRTYFIILFYTMLVEAVTRYESKIRLKKKGKKDEDLSV